MSTPTTSPRTDALQGRLDSNPFNDHSEGRLKEALDLSREIETELEQSRRLNTRAPGTYPPHGLHWWRGVGPEIKADGTPVLYERWHIVHTWTAPGGTYATAAHWTKPLQCGLEMGGTWGPEVIPPKMEIDPRSRPGKK